MRMKKLLSLFLALVMVLTMLPTTVFATGEDVVYISVSYDDKFTNDKNGNPIAFVPVSLEDVANVDLFTYNLGDYWYDPDMDGNFETTALQLIIYAHEELYGGDFSEVTFTGEPGSSYFQGGLFGRDENLNYYLNGQYPLSSAGWGATSDQIVLEAGDFINLAGFTSWDFYQDSGYGFHFFADANGDIVHNYTAEAGTPLDVKLVKGTKDFEYNSVFFDVPDYTVHYGTALYNEVGTVTTDGGACASITFPSAGTWYLWADGGYGNEYPDSIVSAPGYAKVTVTAADVAVSEITLDKGTAALEVGKTVTLTATVAPDNATDKTITWTSSETSVATVNDGVVTAVAAGEATITAKAGDKEATCVVTVTETPRVAQDVSTVLNATMAKLAATVTAPTFGTDAGEWTVLSLARGGYYAKNSQYFTDYYNRIVETVNTTAASVNMNGALHKNKSTENSRLIVALSALGKDATAVGNWNLVEAYSANGLDWIDKQGLNGTIWALIALDSNNYATTDATIRQQCVDAILAAQHDDGGWSLMANKTYASDPDITGMALTALYPYRDQPAVAEACAEAIACLSAMQHDNGTFASGGSECAESCAWVIVACTTWDINPDTDSRFIKNSKSVVDGLLAHYIADSATFQHIIGAGANGMATDQSTYALVAYNRFIKGEAALFDYSDVTFETVEVGETPKATLTLPEEVTNDVGTAFSASVNIDQWDNEAGYKLLDMIVSVPEGLTVTGVTADRLSGGEVSWNLEEETRELRIVYFDANGNNDITIADSTVGNREFPARLFVIDFEVAGQLEEGDLLEIVIAGMSLKTSSDSTAQDAQVIVDVTAAAGEVKVVEGVSYSAVELYKGDNVDLISSTKKAIAIMVTGLKEGNKITFNDGTTTVTPLYSEEMSSSDIQTYVALVDADMDMEAFGKKENYTLNKKANAETITFGDANDDGVINAQDALAAVDAWLRKSAAPEGKEILVLNVNGDSRINTFDALGIVEHFVDGGNYGVVTKVAAAAAK